MNKTTIKAEIVADSLSPQGDRLISVLCTFPRIILAEVNTHRMLSKNTSSSRAIPFKKMVETIENDPFIPIAWQKDHKGMQGTEYITDSDMIEYREDLWLLARTRAIEYATTLNNDISNIDGKVPEGEDREGVTKQLCNRLLEPFMWTTMLITGSEQGWKNFFNLRCPNYEVVDSYGNYNFHSKKELLDTLYLPHEYKDYSTLDWLKVNQGQAEIHMMELAEKIYDAVNESTPKQLRSGEWHIPFGDKLDEEEISELEDDFNHLDLDQWEIPVKISTAMAARTSYTVVGEDKGIDYQKMIGLHDRLINQEPPHSSPLEHCARAMNNEEHRTSIKGKIKFETSEVYEEYENGQSSWIESEEARIPASAEGWCNNFKGFIPYRYLIDNNLKI